MTERMTFEVGQGFTQTVNDYDDLINWMSAEREKWSWLRPGDGATDRFSLASNIQTAWNGIVGDVVALRDRGEDISTLADLLSTRFNGPLLTSPTPDGETVLAIRQDRGEEAAAFAGAVLKRLVSPSQAGNREEFMGMMAALFPDLSNTVQWNEQLKRERANFRKATRDLSDEVDRDAKLRLATAISRERRLLQIARRVFNDRRRRWREAQSGFTDYAALSVSNIEGKADSAIERINNTNEAYIEFMKLKAPVEYWNEKKGFHEGREARARKWLYAYFPITIGALLIAFLAAGNFLISHPAASESNAPVALYVVVSGGLLLLTTLAFWIGRLLTKLYLSEHHLRNDAEERAVMTTTYLALFNDGGASDVDRQLVLGALFRPTPDGIVRDEGPSDLSLQGIITKMMTR